MPSAMVLWRGGANLASCFASGDRQQPHVAPLIRASNVHVNSHGFNRPCLHRLLLRAPGHISMMRRRQQWGTEAYPYPRPNLSRVLAQGASFDDLSSAETFISEDLQKAPTETSPVAENNWLLKLLIVAVLAAAIYTFVSIMKLQASSTLVEEAGVHYKLKLFGRVFQIQEAFPGWGYFWLLMAAGFGLFVSEEAMNIWVGATIARTLTFNGVLSDFFSSIAANSGNISSTLLWVYWGVCISDMIPFYAGRFAVRTKAGAALRKMVGVGDKRFASILQTVQRYGSLTGFVERFSLGVRNPTSFLAGSLGVPPEQFFTGVCLGALITLPIQVGLGFLFRERPIAALAGVAAVVGIWTIIPYASAGIASLIFIIRKKGSDGQSVETTPQN